ncbi:hypothetical protein AC249_AIPGENE16532 [Exaiptasia diaphana]|nr:hypothetical protein AC249_AIPGENE16532 [Exaiptasia diaphana]
MSENQRVANGKRSLSEEEKTRRRERECRRSLSEEQRRLERENHAMPAPEAFSLSPRAKMLYTDTEAQLREILKFSRDHTQLRMENT